MKTELNVLPDVNGNELIIREGKASEIKEPVKFSVDGDITAVSSYLGKRRKAAVAATRYDYNFQPVEDDHAVVVVDKEKQTIELRVTPNDAYGTVIKAELKDSEELKPFFINQNHLFDRKELQKLLRFNKRFFTDTELFDKLYNGLTNLKIDSTINSNVGDDTRGNKNLLFDKKVKSDLPDGFFLLIPIFKNQDAVKFFVELSLDSSEGATRFWLESVELIEIKEKKIDEIFEKELMACEGLVIINK